VVHSKDQKLDLPLMIAKVWQYKKLHICNENITFLVKMVIVS